jgi:hypothetical protein
MWRRLVTPTQSRRVHSEAAVRSVTVGLGAFALEALVGEADREPGYAPAQMVRAVQCYLNDRDAERPGWRYPPFLRDQEVATGERLRLSIDDDLWSEFEAEAEGQGVTVGQLADHAALYFAAELNAGRITERILDELGDVDED